MAENTDQKQRGRPFAKGVSGNPAGRPKGSRNRSSVIAEALLDGEAEELTRTAIQMAKAGDPAALRLCLERLLPPRKDRLVAFDLPTLQNAEDAAKASAAILRAVADGEITPGEAGQLAKLVENFVRTIEMQKQEVPQNIKIVVEGV